MFSGIASCCPDARLNLGNPPPPLSLSTIILSTDSIPALLLSPDQSLTILLITSYRAFFRSFYIEPRLNERVEGISFQLDGGENSFPLMPEVTDEILTVSSIYLIDRSLNTYLDTVQNKVPL